MDELHLNSHYFPPDYYYFFSSVEDVPRTFMFGRWERDIQVPPCSKERESGTDVPVMNESAPLCVLDARVIVLSSVPYFV